MKRPDLDRLRSEGELNISPRRQAWQREHVDEDTRRWLEEDAKHFLHQSLSTPCLDVLVRCEGAWLEDLQGRRFLDFHGNSVHQVGFGHPRVVEAIREQMDTLPFCTRRYTNIPAIELARRLTELAPGSLGKVLFAPGGAAVVGIALKLARMATGRFKTLSMWDSFHGASLDTISIGGEAIFRQDIGPLLPGTEHVPPPDAQHCPWDCRRRLQPEVRGVRGLRAGEGGRHRCGHRRDRAQHALHSAEGLLEDHPRGLRPPRGAARARRDTALPGPDRRRCSRASTTTSFRTWWRSARDWAAGYSRWRRCMVRDDLDVAPDRALGHYTHEKNPVACAAALATIEVIEEEERLLENARDLGDYALERMRGHEAQKHAVIGDIRGLGLLMGMELVKDGKERGTRDGSCRGGHVPGRSPRASASS